MQNTKIKLASGATISKDRQTMFIDPRAGKPKRTQVAFTPAHGMHRASVGEMSAYHHGITQEDEPLEGNKTYERGVALHPATPSRNAGFKDQRGALTENEAKAVLTDAGNLANPNRKGWS